MRRGPILSLLMIILCFGSAIAFPAYAQTTKSAACPAVAPILRFCGEDHGWLRLEGASEKVSAQYTYGDKTAGTLLVDDLGANVGLMPILLRAAVLESASGPKGVKVLGSAIQIKDGEQWETVTFRRRFKRRQHIYMATMWVGADANVVAMTHEAGRKINANHTKLHDDFIRHLQLVY